MNHSGANANPPGGQKYPNSYGAGHTYYKVPPVDLEKTLRPLILHLERYDALRLELEQEGGRVADLKRITELLSTSIRLEGRRGPFEVELTKPAGIRSFLYDVGYNDLHLQVRRRSSSLPVYYLCRVRRDYWSDYSLVLEDFYRSEGYPVQDARFVKLMVHGKETYHLSVAPFRPGTRALFEQGGRTMAERFYDIWYEDVGTTERERVDRLLYDVGRHVLLAAWHEDQQIGVLAAAHFGLPRFRQAIELLYLCLSGDLCELRGLLTEPMHAFFGEVYDQPALYGFLRGLSALDGQTLNELAEERARQLYRQLMQAFKRFLDVDVPVGQRERRTPLYKLLFSNLTRLELVAMDLRTHPAVGEAAAALEASAQRIIEAIVPGTS